MEEPGPTVLPFPVEIRMKILGKLDFISQVRSRGISRLWKEEVDELPRTVIVLDGNLARLKALEDSPSLASVTKLQYLGGLPDELDSSIVERFCNAVNDPHEFKAKFVNLQEITMLNSVLQTAFFGELRLQHYTINLVDCYIRSFVSEFNEEGFTWTPGAFLYVRVKNISLPTAPDMRVTLCNALESHLQPLTAVEELFIMDKLPFVKQDWIEELFIGIHQDLPEQVMTLEILRNAKKYFQHQLLYWASNPQFHGHPQVTETEGIEMDIP